jgi:2-hydroxy-3-oxopropionate reductase
MTTSPAQANSPKTSPILGFIGLGIMGAPMAGHLLSAGYKLCAHSRSGLPEAIASNGAVACANAREVAERAEVIFTMLPDTPDVENVLFGKDGIAAGLGAGKTIVDMSSISPIATKDFAARIVALGCDYLDAPVSGGEVGARNASLSIMVGGSESVYNRALPLLKCMGKNISLVGANGDGQTAKVANQIIVALTIEAVSEALVFAAKAGADPARVREALMGGFASSRILEAHGERMIKRTFTPGFRIRLHQKDLALALDSARAIGVSLPNTANAQELFNACVAQGGRDWDHSAMIRAIERLANFDIGGNAAA